MKQSSGRHFHWVGGAVLVGIGTLLLLRNFGLEIPSNWWALFLLVPAITCFITAWNNYQNNDRQFTYTVRGSLIGGVWVLSIALMFLFSLDWGKMWPVFIILAGLSALVPWQRQLTQ